MSKELSQTDVILTECGGSARNKMLNRIQESFYNLSPSVRLNALAVLVGIIGGLGSWVFRLIIDVAFFIFFTFPKFLLEDSGLISINWLPFLVAPAVGGILVGILTSKVSKETKGHGVPEVLEAVVLHNGRMNLRVPFVKIVASAITIGSGGSAGREGPIAQIGSGFASFVGQKLDLNSKELRTLVIAGVGAGISATFNAPIGGTLFAVEILTRGSGSGIFIPIIVASVIGTVVGQIFLQETSPAFNFPPLEYHNAALIPLFIILGILTGIIAALWIKGFYWSEDIFELVSDRVKLPEFIRPAIGGLLLGVIMVITFFIVGNEWERYTVMGRTYLPIDDIFSGILTTGPLLGVLLILATLFILKAVATVLTVGSGGSGGVFAPTLFLGVMFGGIYGVIARDLVGIPNENVAVFALLGMAALFAGAGRAPLTAVIMTAEMTGDYFLTIPLMFAVSFSWLVASYLQEHDIYIMKLSRRGTKLEEPVTDILDTIKVSEAMTPVEKLTVVQTKMRLEAVLDLIRTTGHSGFPVFNGDDFIDVITLSDVQKALQEHPKGWIVGDVVSNKDKKLIICTDKEAYLSHAVGIMVRREVSRLPIVEKGSVKPVLIGWCTHHDITNLYMKKMASKSLEDMENHMLSY